MSLIPTFGVSLPVYPLVTGPLLHALEHASSVTQSASDEEVWSYPAQGEVRTRDLHIKAMVR
jgi:hypothetical protein